MGVYVADVMREMGAPMVQENFISTRKGIVRFHELSREEQDEIVRKIRRMEESSAAVRRSQKEKSWMRSTDRWVQEA